MPVETSKSPTGAVVCVGEALALVDTAGGLDAAGIPIADLASLAGAEANVACALAAAGIDAHWVGRLGTDELGARLAAELAARGVGIEAVEFDKAFPTGWYSKVVQELIDGPPVTQMVYRRAGSAASVMSAEFLERPKVAAALAGARIVHTSGITPALSSGCAELMSSLVALPRSGRILSFDVNWREQLWPTGDPALVAELAAGANLVSVGADEAVRVFGTDDPVALRRLLPRPWLLVIKDGAVMTTAVDKAGEIIEVPALRVEVVEQVGAGDAFAAGLLSGILRAEPTEQALRRGHLSAARVLTVEQDSAAPFPDEVVEPLLSCPASEWAATRVDVAGVHSPALDR